MRSQFCPPPINAKRKEIATLCREFGIISLDLFGSASDDDWNEASSDLDFVVTFDENPADGMATRYLRFADRLEALLGYPIDLVIDSAIRNPYFRRNVDESRIKVYAA